MQSPKEIIESARESRGLSIEEMAEILGVSMPTYRDFEMHEDELMEGITLGELLRLLRVLVLDTSDVYTKEVPTESPPYTLEELATMVRGYLSEAKLTLAAFEDLTGWEAFDAFLVNPASALEWPLLRLRDTCRVLNIDWRKIKAP